MLGYYYLHVNGALIWKKDIGDLGVTRQDLIESDFCKDFWLIDTEDRGDAWDMLIMALAAGADPERVKDLAKSWGCDDKDALVYASRKGPHRCELDLGMDGPAFTAVGPGFTNLMEAPIGFGDSYLEAMGELCKALGYTSQKGGGKSFSRLLADLAACAEGRS